MNKLKIASFIVLLVSMLAFTGCSLSISTSTATNTNKTAQNVESPDLNRIRNICELATLKCEYHNVAKSTKAPGKGFTHLGEKERKFWIDYKGSVEISYDVSKINMKQDGANITITLPEPKLSCKVIANSWNASSYISSKDKFFQKNPITADDQTQAIKKAQEDMEEQVRNNSSLIRTAERQADELIENYIKQLGTLTGTDYKITWETSSGTSISSASSASTENVSE